MFAKMLQQITTKNNRHFTKTAKTQPVMAFFTPAGMFAKIVTSRPAG